MSQRLAMLTLTMLLLMVHLVSRSTPAASSTTAGEPPSPHPVMLGDLNQDPHSSDPSSATVIGDIAYFEASDRHGRELWRSDGTVAGAYLIKDIYPGPGDSFPMYLTAVGDILYFAANDGVHGDELWRSDGSWAGTYLVKEISPGETCCVENLVALNDILYFTVEDGVHGIELWRSDGTGLLSDLYPGTESVSPSWPVRLNDGVIFYGSGGQDEMSELWKTDGLITPTQVTDLNILSFSGRFPSFLPRFVFKDQLIFVADGQYWRTNGTLAGTHPFLQSDEGTVEIGGHAVANDRLYVFADVWGWQFEEFLGLYESDGTETRLLDLGFTWISSLLSYEDTLYIIGRQTNIAPELWRSDGTKEGTVPITDSNIGIAFIANGKLCFTAVSSEHPGVELWCNDLTSGDTQFLKPFGDNLSVTQPMTVDPLFFFVVLSEQTAALWRSDGSGVGTFKLKEFQTLSDWAALGGVLYFFADDGKHGRELWRSDGSVAGTSMVADILPGAGVSTPQSLTAARNGLLYFRANDGFHGHELWQSDGTAGGTRLVADILPGPVGSWPEHLADVMLPGKSPLLFFSANDGFHGHELWTLPYDIYRSCLSALHQPALRKVKAKFYPSSVPYDLFKSRWPFCRDCLVQRSVIVQIRQFREGDNGPVRTIQRAY